MTGPALEDRLGTSDGFKSLLAERVVCAALADAGWSAVHSSFYRDRRTGKLREMDVLGRQRWTRKLRHRERTLDLFMPFEVKTAGGFHLVFAPTETIEIKGHLQRQWIGYEGPVRRTVVRGLQKLGLTPHQLVAFAEGYSDLAYPGGAAAPRDLMVDPPILEWNSTAFRETNIGGTKGLNNSVVWKAGLVLRSGIDAIRRDRFLFHLSWITADAQYAQSLGQDPVEAALDTLANHVIQVDQFHPAVIVDSRLWMTSGANVVEIPWCRFTQVNHRGHAVWWYDVVRSTELKRYLTENHEWLLDLTPASACEANSVAT